MTVTISGNGTVTGVTSAVGLISSGTVAYFAASTAPTGWLAADGSAISRTTYASLFAAIGTTFGSGDGSTTFNLPNLGGQFVRSWISGQSTDSGRTFGSNQAGAFASHNHGVSDPGHYHPLTTGAVAANFSSVMGSGGTVSYGGGDQVQNTSTSSTGISVNNSGGTETRPVNVALLGCIKT